jgi:hypothetical protein
MPLLAETPAHNAGRWRLQGWKWSAPGKKPQLPAVAACRAAGAGVLAAAVLAAIKGPVTSYVLELSEDVLHEVAGYWWLRTGLVPVLLFNMSVSGILQVTRPLLPCPAACL